MPSAVSIKVLNEIKGNYVQLFEGSELQMIKNNLGYAEYLSTKKNSFWNFVKVENVGGSKYSKIDDYFENYTFAKKYIDSNTQKYVIDLNMSQLMQAERILRYDILSPINLLITDEE
jgi:hypothetical protein